MNQGHQTPPAPIELQPLEPRLMLSAYPILQEQAQLHDTLETAQVITEAFAPHEMDPEVRGVKVYGHLAYHGMEVGGETDIYRIDLDDRAFVAIDHSDSLVVLDGQGNWITEFSGYGTSGVLLDEGQYYLKFPESFDTADYSIEITLNHYCPNVWFQD